MSLICPPASLHGAARPRVELHPPYVDSYAAEAVELAARAGLTLDQWQQDALNLLLAVRDDRMWACGEYAEWVPRQNGKGGFVEARALAGFLLLGEELVTWTAHEFKTSIRAFRRLRRLIQRLGYQPNLRNDNYWLIPAAPEDIPVKISNTNGEEGFERLDTEAELKFLARSKGSGRGFSGDLVVIDEAYAYTDEQQEALFSTMSARPNPQIVYTSTPPLSGTTGEIMYRLRDRAEAGGDESLGYRDFGLPGDLDDVDKLDDSGRPRIDIENRALWAASNPAYGIRISEQFVRKELRTLSHIGFARERLGVWPKRIAGSGEINMDAWRAIQDPDSRRTGACALAVDVSPRRDRAAITLYGAGITVERDGEPVPLGHAYLVDHRPGTAWIAPRLAELREVLDPVAVGMGPGTFKGLALELADVGLTPPDDHERPERGYVLVMSGSDMAAACGAIIEAVRTASMLVRPDPAHPEVLDSAVEGAQVRQGVDAVAWSRTGDADITPLVALTGARWAFLAGSHFIDQEVEPWVAFV